jgi:hypothetical protein
MLVGEQLHFPHDGQLRHRGGTAKIVKHDGHLPIALLDQCVSLQVPIMRTTLGALTYGHELVQNAPAIPLQKLSVNCFEASPIRFRDIQGHKFSNVEGSALR